MSALIVAFGFVLSLFAVRLVELQALRGPDLAAAALQQRIVTQDIPATRGQITDVNGVPLATSIEVRDITADQTLVTDPAATAAVLGPMLGMQPAQLQPLLTGTRRFIYIKKATDPKIWRDIQTWKADPTHDPSTLQAIFSERRTIRDYPNSDLASNVLGFVNAEGHGAVGLEAGLEALLAGTPGKVTYEEAAGGTEIPTSDVQRVDPKAGTSVQLTIDSDLQALAQQAVASQVKAKNADFGMAIVLEVGTGRILAMVTAPDFNPNNPQTVKPEWWANRPVTYAIEPGSTAKLMSLSAVLDQGKMTPNSHIQVPSVLMRGGRAFHDAEGHGVEDLTLTGILAKSSNMGTILASEKIGGQGLYQYLRSFGVGETTGLNYPGEATGYVPNPKDWSDTTFPTLAFGQGMSLTALQILNVAATIANNGVPVTPRLIDRIMRPDGTQEATTAVPKAPVLKPETAATMRRMMQMVVSDGGTAADVAKVPGYLVGGKTGTAMRYDETVHNYSGYTSSFIGMAPADAPKIVVGAWFDNPKGDYFGASVAGPVVQKIMTSALASQNIPPTGGKPAHLPLVHGLP